MTIQDNVQLLVEEAVESGKAPRSVQAIQRRAKETGLSFLDYIAKTSPDLKEVFDQMLLAEIHEAEQQRLEAQQDSSSKS